MLFWILWRLRSSNPKTRLKALNYRIGRYLLPGNPKRKQVIDALKDLLTTQDKPVRHQTALWLGHIGDDRAIPALEEILMNPSGVPYGVRADAVCKLSKFHQPRVLRAIVATLSEKDLEDAACSVLEQMTFDWKASEEGKLAISDLVQLVLSGRLHIVRQRALSLLASRATPEMLISLLNRVSQRDTPVRYCAADLLGVIKTKEAIDRLIDLLNDSEEYVREAAGQALAKSGERRAVTALLNALKNPGHGVRLTLDALDRLDPNWSKLDETESAVPSLLSIIKRGNSHEFIKGSSPKQVGKI